MPHMGDKIITFHLKGNFKVIVVSCDNSNLTYVLCLFVFVALRPKSTAMVIAGWSVHLTTLFPGQA